MAKGNRNPLTTQLEDAEAAIRDMEAALLKEFGLALYTEEQGTKPVWPADPEQMSPETMQELIDTRGEQAVNEWLQGWYQSKAERDALAEQES